MFPTVRHRIPGVGRIAELSNMHFARTGNAMRTMLFERSLENAGIGARLFGKTKATSAAERRRTVELINSLTGFRNGKVTKLEQVALFAPRFFRAQLDVLSRAVTNFSGRDGALAREALTKTFIAGAVLVIAINETRGERTDLNPMVRTSRGLRVNGNFLRIKNASGDDI